MFPAPMRHHPALPIGSICMYAGDVAFVSDRPNPAWSHCAVPGPAGAPVVPVAAVALLEAEGWMVCDGRSLYESKYPHLYAVLGTRYGSDGAGLFCLPDYRGAFLRGVDHGAGVDPDAAERKQPDGKGTYAGVGSMQRDAFELHQHKYNDHVTPATIGKDGSGALAPAATIKDTEVPVSGRHSSETRPKNIAVYFIIRCR